MPDTYHELRLGEPYVMLLLLMFRYIDVFVFFVFFQDGFWSRHVSNTFCFVLFAHAHNFCSVKTQMTLKEFSALALST